MRTFVIMCMRCGGQAGVVVSDAPPQDEQLSVIDRLHQCSGTLSPSEGLRTVVAHMAALYTQKETERDN